jgi:hydroxyacylglutathione hydrolase
MEIHQIFTGNTLRNFTYVLEWENGEGWCVDPWDAPSLISWLKRKKIALTRIINTHEHHDHVRGNEGLCEETGAQVYCHHNALKRIPRAGHGLDQDSRLSVQSTPSSDWSLRVLDTPGHTMAHLCLLIEKHGRAYGLISGDTLFNAGVGNCHNGGDPETLYETIIGQVFPLPDEVIVYPGHDYLVNNLKFTLDREPLNQRALELLNQVTKAHEQDEKFMVTNLGLERQMNCFFRLDSIEIKQGLGLPSDSSEREVFLALRSARNHW